MFIYHFVLRFARSGNVHLDLRASASNGSAMRPVTTMVISPVAPADDHDSRHSSLRASILEHLFLGQLLRELWRRGDRNIELLRAEVDASGYDIVLACNNQVRYIQLKTSHSKAKTRAVPINVGLRDRPGGCVIWIKFDRTEMTLGPFLWFGGTPGEGLPPLGNQMGRHTRRAGGRDRGERPAIRVLNKNDFTKIETIPDLIIALFGHSSGSDIYR